MSFYGSRSEVVSIIGQVEESENTHSSTGSKILNGHGGPGGAAEKAKPSGETLKPGRLRAGINTPKTSTDSLTRCK